MEGGKERGHNNNTQNARNVGIVSSYWRFRRKRRLKRAWTIRTTFTHNRRHAQRQQMTKQKKQPHHQQHRDNVNNNAVVLWHQSGGRLSVVARLTWLLILSTPTVWETTTTTVSYHRLTTTSYHRLSMEYCTTRIPGDYKRRYHQSHM